MPTPFRLTVLRALTDTLENITLTDTDNTAYSGQTLDGAVFRGRLTYGPSDPLPMVSIVEQIEEGDFFPASDGGTGVGSMKLVIQGWVEDDDPTHPTDTVQWLMADVKKALSAARVTRPEFRIFGLKKVKDMRIGRGVVRPAEEGISSKAHFALGLILNLVESDDDPYAEG